MSEGPYIWSVGRRKSAVARVRLYPGSGTITVNGRPATDYFGGRAIYQASLLEPLLLTATRDRFNVTVRVVGGALRRVGRRSRRHRKWDRPRRGNRNVEIPCTINGGVKRATGDAVATDRGARWRRRTQTEDAEPLAEARDSRFSLPCGIESP